MGKFLGFENSNMCPQALQISPLKCPVMTLQPQRGSCPSSFGRKWANEVLLSQSLSLPQNEAQLKWRPVLFDVLIGIHLKVFSYYKPMTGDEKE
jgi:hypothetical protein